jgi:hypothetical protein
MAITKYLARDLSIGIHTAAGVDTILGTEDDVVTNVGGLNSLTHAPSTTRADTSSFDSNGRDEHLPASRGDTWTLAGFSLEDVSGGANAGDRDPGQTAVEALGKLVGPAGIGWFTITSPGGNKIRFEASAEVTLGGGGHNDAAAWQAVIQITGEPVYVPAP